MFLSLGDGFTNGRDPLFLGVFIIGQQSDGSVIVLSIKTLSLTHSEGILVGALVTEGSVEAARSVGRLSIC